MVRLPSGNLGYVDMQSQGCSLLALHWCKYLVWAEVHRGMCAGVNWINEKLWFTRGQMCSKPIIIMITLSIKYFIMIQYSYKTDNGFSWSIQQLESEKNVWAFQGLLWSDIVAWQYNCLLYGWNSILKYFCTERFQVDTELRQKIKRNVNNNETAIRNNTRLLHFIAVLKPIFCNSGLTNSGRPARGTIYKASKEIKSLTIMRP